jgi:hypothetical protein
VVRYPGFRWLVVSVALAVLAGSYALHALFAQDGAIPAPPAWPGGPAPTPPAPHNTWWGVPTANSPAQTARQDAPPATAPAAPPTGDAIYRINRDVQGDAKPIFLDADEIFTWNEQQGGTDYLVVLVRGLVLAEQHMLQARFQQGVAWIDVTRFKNTGKLRMELYAEGDVRVDNGSIRVDSNPIQQVPRAILDVTTRGEFHMRAHHSKVVRESRGDDPLVQRGRAEGLGPPWLRPSPSNNRKGPTGVQQTSHQERRMILPPTVAPEAPRPQSFPVPGGPNSSSGTFVPRMAPPDDPPAPSSGQLPRPVSLVARETSAVLTNTPDVPGQGSPTSPEVTPPVPAGPPAASGPGTFPPGSSGPGVIASPPGLGLPAGTPPPTMPPAGTLPAPRRDIPLPPPSQVIPPRPLPTAARNYTLVPRLGGKYNIKLEQGANGETAIIVTGGIILQVRNAPGVGLVDMEADRVVIWTRGKDAQRIANNLKTPEGDNSNDLEFYLSGHVIVRQAPLINPRLETRTIRADEVYYDVSRNVAVALNTQLEMKQPLTPDPLIARSKELVQTSINTFELVDTEIFSSKLPSDPGLKVFMKEALLEEKDVPLINILGQPALDRKTGQPVVQRQTWVTGNTVVFQLAEIPVFYLPQTTINAQQPLGPVQDFNGGFSQIYGAQFMTSLDVYQLLGIQARPNTRWLWNLDYLSYRGPGMGTTYNYAGTELFTMPAKYTGQLRLFGMYDRNFDDLGGPRPVNNFDPPNFRGWGYWSNIVEDMPYGFTFLSQVSALSDRNFLEQYYKRIFDMNPNQATFAFLEEQQNQWAWSLLVEPRIRNWVTETQSLPRFDGWVVGQDIFQQAVYNTHVNLEYANLALSHDPLPQESPLTDVTDQTFRGSWMQELLVPFYLGPLKVTPYARTEWTAYSSDVNQQPMGRLWDSAGVELSIPFTHLYPSVQSELWNLNGINHKIVATANYFAAYSGRPYTMFPQLDRLNDDATNQALRDIKNYQFELNPQYGIPLATDPLYLPQTYAIRRLNFMRIDTLDTIDELQLNLRQRLQTKRGFPGNQHIVDWMVLDTSATYFPNPNRDDFSSYWAFLEYNYLWNIGDRTALTTYGWMDPFPLGPKVWTIGGYFNRPDRTNFFLGYREIYPLNSKAVIASFNYVFSPKYAATLSSTYDFGTGEALANSVMFTRMGSDIQVSLGFTYNALQNNFGLMFNVVPNLLPANRALGPISAAGGGSQQGVLK